MFGHCSQHLSSANGKPFTEIVNRSVSNQPTRQQGLSRLKKHEYRKDYWRSSHYAVTRVRNKNSKIQGRSPNVVKVINHTIKTTLKGNNLLPLGANSFL